MWEVNYEKPEVCGVQVSGVCREDVWEVNYEKPEVCGVQVSGVCMCAGRMCGSGTTRSPRCAECR